MLYQDVKLLTTSIRLDLHSAFIKKPLSGGFHKQLHF